MKTKTKMLAMLEIAIVLCSLFLVALPAIAAEQTTQKVSASEVTTASEDDYVLGIYGNANEDDTIDMRDLTYVKLIFFGKKPETELADAKYDGKINPLDFIQIKLIIVGKEKELTLIDSADRIVTVKKPLKRVVTCVYNHAETMRSIKAADKIVGVDESVIKNNLFFPEFSDHPNVGKYCTDVEKVLELQPDTVILYTGAYFDEVVNKLESADPNIIVLRFDCYKPTNYVDEVIKLGYVFGKKKEAEEFIDFYEGVMNTIEEEVKGIPEDEKPRVYFESYKPYHTAAEGAGWHKKVIIAGGNNIFGDLSGYPTVDPEAVIERDPDIIVKTQAYKGGYSTDDITELSDIRNEIMSRPELAKVSAVKNERVYVITETVLGGPGHFIGIAYMAKWFHPDLFEDLDPEAIHQEYLTKFQGLEYDLDEHGVFVYPPIIKGKGKLAGIPDRYYDSIVAQP